MCGSKKQKNGFFYIHMYIYPSQNFQTLFYNHVVVCFKQESKKKNVSLEKKKTHGWNPKFCAKEIIVD